MAGYVSEFTQFLREMKASNPNVEEGQKKGRSLLWDKVIDREAQHRFEEVAVPQQPYVYQNHVGPTPPASGADKPV